MSRRHGLAVRWPLALLSPTTDFSLNCVERNRISMTQLLEFARRAARLRAPLFVGLAMVFSACNATDNLSPTDTPADTPAPAGVTADDPSLSTSFRGGIPMGTFALPTTQFGSTFNGALRNIWPGQLVSELRSIKARGGKI